MMVDVINKYTRLDPIDLVCDFKTQIQGLILLNVDEFIKHRRRDPKTQIEGLIL